MDIGPYTGEIADTWDTPGVREQLASLTDHLSSEGAAVIAGGRNRSVLLSLGPGTDRHRVVVKTFGRPNLLQDLLATRRGSKARRTWVAACHLQSHAVGTPPPLAFLERRQAGRLVESHVLTVYQDNVTNFRDELIRLFLHDPECERFMTLLQRVADAVRAMHATGFQHNDLGNQNVFLRRKGADDWECAQFLDLNRARIRPSLSLRRRARDLSRVYLPSDLLRVFFEMYFDSVTPPVFERWERFYRRLYAWHDRTRALRHPVRETRRRRLDRERVTYPPEKDMWIWDERSAQPISTLRSRDRHRHYPVLHVPRLGVAVLRGIIPVWRHYRHLMAEAFARPVSMADRVGVAVNPRPETWDRERELLQQLGPVPVLIRFYHHESLAEWNYLAERAHELKQAGHAVAVALVQDHRAVLEPDGWAAFVSHVLSRAGDVADHVELGHAVNRVKWGLWGPGDYGVLARAAAAVADFAPGAVFTGPAGIDFEYADVMAALASVPPGLHFAALSHHLYVDRRGAPENRQGRFAALEKFALARAIARWSPVCDDRLVVSEVNWPLAGTGVHSPVSSPYEYPGVRRNDPSVDEATYADFMIRYLLIAIGSGLVERVYWWRLVARGFGLVDDTRPDAWRERPAYAALKRFLGATHEARFVARETPAPRRHVYRFEQAGGAPFTLAYSEDGPIEWPAPCSEA